MLSWLLVFLLCLVVFEALVLVWWQAGRERLRMHIVKSLASKISMEGHVHTTVLEDRPERPGGLRAALESLRTRSLMNPVDKLAFLVITALMAAAGFAIGTRFMTVFGIFAPVIGACGLGFLPKLLRSRKKDKRFREMEDQFPEALDFLARSVRAGNAFSIALELLASESAEPMKTEIVKITREMALGASLEEALQGLIARVPLVEVRMFVAAVLLQRETGGNLSEVLNKLAASVRDRLRLRGQVRASSGQGRLTARVLTFMPIVVFLALRIVSPTYLDGLLKDPVGPNLMGLAVVSQIVGYVVMQKVLDFEV
jgi:tight adherence protein B